jgi:very-short-patch-repair endonuclease
MKRSEFTQSLPSGAGATSPLPQPGEGAGERAKRAPLLKHAKTLRTHQTEAEQKLWYHLRAKRLCGLKFKRQKPIGPYIVDFVCMEHRLIVEADGGQHGGAKDEKRDAWFAGRGYTVLRFWNHEILNETDAVLERIRETFSALSPRPSPAHGRGAHE